VILGCAHFVFAQSVVALKGQVNSDNINLRADSTPVSEVICIVNKGTEVEVVEEYYDWYKIRLPKSAPSYIKKRFVACLDEAVQPVCSNARVISNRVNIRARPSESAPILGRADKTQSLVILSEEKGWYKIQPIPNSYAWIHKKFIDPIPQLTVTEAVDSPATETAKTEKSSP
jgi:uncharacterized protein YgiM (DUF1202 family)